MRAAWALGVGAALTGSSAFGAFVAYNDFIGNYVGSALAPNVTQYPVPASGATPTANALKDDATGASLAATMSVTNNLANIGGTGPANPIAAGTDAYNLFNGKVDTTGNVVYYATGWSVVLNFAGLDAAQKYTFAAVMDRGDSTYANLRWTTVTLSGATAATYAASAGTGIPATPGVIKVSDSEASLDSYNTVAGNIARWTDISPSANGQFTVTFAGANLNNPTEYPAGLSTTAHIYKGYAPAGIMLQEQAVPEPAALGLLALGGLLGLRRRR